MAATFSNFVYHFHDGPPILVGPKLTSFPPVTGGYSPQTGNTYVFQTPMEVPSKSIIFGNVTFCCTDAPSTSNPVNSGDKLLPRLYVLSSMQFSSWEMSRPNPPSEYIATTSSAYPSPYRNYTYSGPTATEALSFHLQVEDSGVYYLVTFQVGTEQATMHLNVLATNYDETMFYISLALLLAAVISLSVTIWKYKHD